MNTLKQYLKKQKLSTYKFAKDNDITQPACRRAVLGHRMSPEIAYKIVLASDGNVDFLTLLFPKAGKKKLKKIASSISIYT